jgi:steroid delta-isomerase-like uncharacterized protein
MPEEENTLTIPAMVEAVRSGKMSHLAFVEALTAMDISAAGVEAIAAAATHAPASTSAPVAHPDEQATTSLHLQGEQSTNQARRNGDTQRSHYAEYAVVEDSLYPEPFVGRVAIMTRTHGRIPAIPDLKITVINHVEQGNQVSTEWVATGTHVGDLPGLPASGRSFSIPGVTVVIRRNGEIVRESLYYDMEEVRHQLSR